MKIIKLNEQATISRQGKYGWEETPCYEAVYISPAHIESMSWAGLTYISLASSRTIKVKETPEEILALMEEGK